MRMAFASLILAVAAEAAPERLLTSFEEGDPEGRVAPGGARTERVAAHATHGKMALHAVFPGSAKDTWPGIQILPPDPDLRREDMLVMDVTNPRDKPVALNWRVDDAAGLRVFGGTTLTPRSVTSVEIPLAGLKSQLDLSRIARVFPYIRMPREDVELYFDRVRFETFAGRFEAMVYRHTGPIAPPEAADREAGCQLYSRHWMDMVFPASRPRPEDLAVRLRAFAAPGETEPVTLEMLALRDLDAVSVRVGDLVRDGARIPASAVRVYPVRCLDKRTTYSAKTYVKDLPVLLEERPAVDIPEGASRRFWLDIAVPGDAEPGVYSGTATVYAGERVLRSVPLRLRVLPFVLPEPIPAILGDYYRGPVLARTEEQKREFLVRDLRAMRRQGMTSVGLCFGLPADRASLRQDGVDLALDGSSLFELFLDTYRELGFPAPVVILADSGQHFASSLGLVLGTTEHNQAYTGFWRALQAACRERGWPELIVQPVDEPGWQSEESRARNVALLKLLKAIPGMRTEQDGPGDAYFHNVAGPLADVWNYNGSLAEAGVVQRAREAGHTILIYNCDVESYRPEVGRYVAGFFQRRAGISGYYNWAYMSFSGSPYSDLDYKTGTWMHVYPPYEDEVGGPSTGWQGHREGIDDLRTLTLLENAIAAAEREGDARARVHAARGRETLDMLLDSLAYSPAVRNRARWTETGKDGDVTTIGGTLKLTNGWGFETYDAARWQVAVAAAEILAALGRCSPLDLGVEAAAGVAAAPGVRRIGAPAAAASAASPGGGGEERHVNIPTIAVAPTIDGAIGDAAWSQGVRVGPFVGMKGGTPQANTEAWLATDGRELFIAFRCQEPFLDHITAAVDQDGGPVWQDDCVEVFLDPEGKRSGWRQIVVNSLGRMRTTASGPDSWQPAVRRAARRGDEEWCVELAVALEDLDLAGDLFGLNLCRERRPTEVLELSSWSPTGDRFARPERFGTAVLGYSLLQRVSVGSPALGENVLGLLLALPEAGGDTPVEVGVTWHMGPGGRSRQAAQTARLGAGEPLTLEFPYTLEPGDAELEIAVVVRRPGGAAPLAQRHLRLSVPEPIAVNVDPRLCVTGGSPAAASVQLHVSGALRATCRVALRIVSPAPETVIEEAWVEPEEHTRWTMAIHTGGLAPARYRLRACLVEQASGRTVVERECRLDILADPYAGW
ncbi:MAG: hypothetical protein JXR77_04295 [Lentisphaeria bacterium]|nr:hypothetical protein [Lentisphaeria bacterium]